MSAVLTRTPTPVLPAGQLPTAPGQTQHSSETAHRRTFSSGDFASVLGAYRSSGGTARGDDLARLLHRHRRGDDLSLARLIASGGVFGFEWRPTLWIPMCQFEPLDLSPKPAVQCALLASGSEFDDCRRACWFAEAHARLHDCRPADVLDADLQAVLDAAQADRLGAAGRPFA